MRNLTATVVDCDQVITGVVTAGDKGDKGDQGIQGIQGPRGDKGDKGDIGLTGPKGDQGIQGIQGTQGPQGEVSISKAADNRLEMKDDGLYVRDRLDPEPVAYYLLSRG